MHGSYTLIFCKEVKYVFIIVFHVYSCFLLKDQEILTKAATVNCGRENKVQLKDLLCH